MTRYSDVVNQKLNEFAMDGRSLRTLCEKWAVDVVVNWNETEIQMFT